MAEKKTAKRAPAKKPERRINPKRPDLGHLDERQIDYIAPPPTWDERTQSWVNQQGQPVCGAKRSQDGGVCCMVKGWGTEHVGYGRCKRHGGTTANGNQAALKERLRKERPVLGAPIRIGPHEAILQEIHYTAGHVAWLREMIHRLGDGDESPLSLTEGQTKLPGTKKRRTGANALTQVTMAGVHPSVWIEMYQEERKHLINVCKAAVNMGVAERQVRIAEEQGNLIASVVMNIFQDPDLGLTALQRNALPEIARRHFTELSANSDRPATAPALPKGASA